MDQDPERAVLRRVRSRSVDERTVIVGDVGAIADGEDVERVRDEVLIRAVEGQAPEAVKGGDDGGFAGEGEEVGLVGREGVVAEGRAAEAGVDCYGGHRLLVTGPGDVGSVGVVGAVIALRGRNGIRCVILWFFWEAGLPTA